jgi:hypothetical protein
MHTLKSQLSECRTFAQLIELLERHGGRLVIACDTEYKGPHTLTVQFAVRLGRTIIVQVYYSPAILPQPDADKLLPHIRKLKKRCRNIIIREGRPLSADLSPARVLAALFGMRGVEPMPRSALRAGEQPAGVLDVTFVAHFWTADFFRIFGREFTHSLYDSQLLGGGLYIENRKLLAYKEGNGYRSDAPVLEYAFTGAAGEVEDIEIYGVRVHTFDTSIAFGQKAKLDDLAQTFVGVKKLKGFGAKDKADMLATFNREPERAYAYALCDPILTLLVYEGIAATHETVYRKLGHEGKIPPLHPTLGRRVSELLAQRVVARSAAGSVLLSHTGAELKGGGVGKADISKVRRLLQQGSKENLVEAHLSWFGEQTGHTHGGLLFSRSPTQLYHHAPGMFRDVDLKSCYAQVMMASMSLYAGRPVVHEPGRAEGHRMTLKEAVALVEEHAAGRDAWIIKVSGQIAAFPNVLIPSTKEALTNANRDKRAARRKAKEAESRYGNAFDWREVEPKLTANTAIFTEEIQAGVVAWPTWLMIQALPPAWRQQYENLEVDSVIFYPRQMVAEDGPGYDALVRKYSHEGTSWTATLHLGGDRPHEDIRLEIDDKYVALRFDLGELARTMQQQREEARGTPVEKGWKETVNSIWGILACPVMVTNNIVAANYVSAAGRALAFAMQLSLNGVQVITDGCTYRRDQIPAGTLADCLAACPDYPINRADFAGPYLDSAAIPDDPKPFTGWYREHVKRFFGVSGKDYDDLFDLSTLEHKATGKNGPVAFDGLCCNGPGNYLKLLHKGGRLKVAEFKIRSYTAKGSKALATWIVRTFSRDRYNGPPPPTESERLLKYTPACKVAHKVLKEIRTRRAIQGDSTPATVYYPLGLAERRANFFKVLTKSTFLYRNARQLQAFEHAFEEFRKATGCGLEGLALRRNSTTRRRGSLADIAKETYRLIRAGETNPSAALNLTRPSRELDAVREWHRLTKQDRKYAVLDQQVEMLDADVIKEVEGADLTGLFVQLRDIFRMTRPSD